MKRYFKSILLGIAMPLFVGSAAAGVDPVLIEGSPVQTEPSELMSVPKPVVEYTFYLGGASGKLKFRAFDLSSASRTPAALLYEEVDGVEVILDISDNVRQIYAPDVVVDVVTVDSDTFEISFYETTGTETQSSGLYVPNGDLIIKWEYDNPGNSADGNPQIKVTRTKGGDVSTCYIEKIVGGWRVAGQGGDRVEEISWSNITGEGANRLRKVHVVMDATGDSPVLVSKNATEYEEYSWGWEKVREAQDPDGANLVSTWSYYDEATLTAMSVAEPEEDARFQSVFVEVGPTGRWTKYLDYDEVGATQILQSWLDVPLEGVTESDAKFTVRTPITGGTRMETFITGIQVTKSESVKSGLTQTSKSYYGSGSSDHLDTVTTSNSDGQVTSIDYPDDRRDAFSFENGDWEHSTNTFTVDAEGAARRRTVTHGTGSAYDGIANKTTRERTVTDEDGHLVYRETFVYNGSGYDLMTATKDTYSDGHLVETDRDGVVIYEAAYSDGLLISETNETGAETTYTYDDSGRVATQTLEGDPDVVTSYVYDIEGRAISETVTAGDSVRHPRPSMILLGESLVEPTFPE